MKCFFRKKINKVVCLMNIIMITAMLAVFSLVLPDFMTSAAGRAFAGVWSLLAFLVLLSHAITIRTEAKVPVAIRGIKPVTAKADLAFRKKHTLLRG